MRTLNHVISGLKKTPMVPSAPRSGEKVSKGRMSGIGAAPFLHVNAIPNTNYSEPVSSSAGNSMVKQRMTTIDLSRRTTWSTIIASLLVFALLPVAAAQEPQRTEKFIPADEMDALFERDKSGVMMKREEFKSLLQKARENSSASEIPIPIITEQARIQVTPGDQQAVVTMNLKVRQYAEGWQILRIRAGNLLVEKVEIDGQPALVARDPADPTALLLAHEKIGEFNVVATMSTPLAVLGSDLSAAFELPIVPAVQLSVQCPAGRHLLINDLQLERPTPDSAVAEYVVPVGNAANVSLRWGVQRKESESQTLIFVRTDAQLQIQKETLRWESDSRVSVFGGSVNKIVAIVPARLEVTSVESTGLEGWTLADDPEKPSFTRVTLTYRQPFTNDRLIRIRAVAASESNATEGLAALSAMQKIPTLQFAEVTAHTGRLVVNHEDGLRLVAEAGGGVRPMSATELGISTEASVFDFWLQQFELQVAAKARDRELFAESSGTLVIDDTSATFEASLTIETLNAPLFELLLTLPADWQLSNVSASEVSNLTPEIANGLTWTNAGESNQILVRPAQLIAPGQLMTVIVKLNRTLSDPDIEQKLALPVVAVADTTTVGGNYTVRFSDDLIVSPLSLIGLTPLAGSGTEQLFQNLGGVVAGELSIVRRPARLAARSVLKTWADSRQQSLDAEIITDVLNGTIRTLTIRLSETLGPDVRFEVRSVGTVPGLQQTRAVRQVTIAEQSAGTPVDGLRPFILKLDHRFAGSLSLHASVQQPRVEGAPIAAPILQVQDAVRQHGVLVFEASPEQQLSADEDVNTIPGLFRADAGLVDTPDASAGRRIALIYRFVQPGYLFNITETRFVTNTVPSAICEELNNVCTLNESGSIQRWSQATIRSSGVQTVRFSLPGKEGQSFLWSTTMNGEPVEVRRDGGDYLVAVPMQSESQVNKLAVLFESSASNAGAFETTDQEPVEFSIDAAEQSSVPLDVLRQTWRVHYPQSALLVDSDGQFRPIDGVDQPGWLVGLGRISWPDADRLPARLIPLCIFLLVIFIVTVMISRRRWKTMAAILGTTFLLIFAMTLLPLGRQFRSMSADEKSSAPNSRSYAVNTQESGTASPASGNGFPSGPQTESMGDAYAEPFGDSDGKMAGEPHSSDMSIALGVPAEMPAAPGSMGGMGGAVAPRNAFNEPSDLLMERVELESKPSDPFTLPQVQASPAEPLQEPVRMNQPEVASVDKTTIAKRKAGNARLSVNVNLEVPSDYQSREFVSVADSVHRSSVLSLMIQKRNQIAGVRFLAALVVVLLAWSMRNAALLPKLTFSIVLLLCALALLPLLPNAWQSVLDGIAIGSLISGVMALTVGCCRFCTCPLTWLRKSSAVAALLLGSLCGMPLCSAQDSGIPNVVVPYAPDEPALRADQVFISQADFLRLYQQANPDALKASSTNPLGSSVVASFFKTGALTAVEGSKYVLSCEGRFVVWSDSDAAISVALPVGPVAIRSLQVDGTDGTVQPLLVGVEGTEIQNFASQQIQQSRQAPIPSSEGPAYAVQVTGKGLHVVDLKFDIAALIEGDLGRADFPLRAPVSGTLEWTLPADGLDARIHGRTNVYRREGRTVIVPIAQLSTIRLQWLPTVQKAAADVVFHSTSTSTLAVQDSGLTLRTSVNVAVRQGEMTELEVTIPEGYSMQSVSGADVAGWAIQSTDATRAVKLQLRRTVTDATAVTLQLFAAMPSAESLASLSIPIAVVRGAGRDHGSVILKAGEQFQVRSESLSAVTQINPNEATGPEGDDLPGRPMLAWRYTRHPASVHVKVTPTADELVAEALHAVRLEEQRQLWSSRMTVQISGAPRSRIDIAVPAGFLPLDVKATALKDWYLSDDPQAADAPVAADAQAVPRLRTLSIQFTDARRGQLQIALQGQMSRDADRSTLTMSPPVILNATKAKSELAVWLDAASEIASAGDETDWTSLPAASVPSAFHEICQTPPSVAFQSSIASPRPLSLKLRPAVSTLIGESVTVTNVTETALELTLALNWQIARAAADQFAVELPTSVASIMTFEVPGQRRLTREELGNGKTRITFQLQQPITERLFVLGTASLPLPADKVIRSEVPVIVIPANAASTLSGQAHFWVLVNQSNGLLQPGVERPEDRISPEQITTQIPPQLLQQAVAVVKLKPDTPSWNLVYPEQHQVAPAVVNLATHTTVISDDGSWRSRHQLEVTNESRQFLPVIFPKGSRLLYCLVQGQPGRVVVRGDGNDVRHLIPIPQSGALASGFEVEFALAGRFDDSAAFVREQWRSRKLHVPVPRFPEFRDDPEFGISVTRNRWSVYVPETWRATLFDDPAETNVVTAESDQLADASLLSDVEQAAALLKSAKSAKGSYLRGRAVLELQRATENLNQHSGHDSGVEEQRGTLLKKLNELNTEYSSGAQQPGVALNFSNRFLYEAEVQQNSANMFNSTQFWSFNGTPSGYGSMPNGAPNQAAEQLGEASSGENAKEILFRFGITQSETELQLGKEFSKDRKEDKSEAAANPAASNPLAAEKSLRDEATKDGEMNEGESRGLRSKLMQRRAVQADTREQVEELSKKKSNTDGSGTATDSFGSYQANELFLGRQAGSETDSPPNALAATAPAVTIVPTGLLSLQFEIPTDGVRMDFLRIGGNPELSLNVQSANAVRKGTGLIWLILCAAGGLLLVGPGLRAQPTVFCLRLFGILAVAGFAIWIFTAGALQATGLLVCLASVIGVAVVTSVINLRRRA